MATDPDGEGVAEAAVWLSTAAPLALDAIPATAEAHALVDAIAGRVLDQDATRRAEKLRATLTAAVGAIVGGLLRSWSHAPARPVFRRGKAGDFTGGPVPYRQFIAAMDGLGKLGLVVTQRGYQRAIDWGDSKSWFGKAARFWPTTELLNLAATDGVTADTVGQHFTTPPPTKPPTVRAPIVVTSLKQTTGRRTGQGTKQRLESEVLGPDLVRLRQEVEEVNAFAEQIDVRGCLPPRWCRVFTVNASLGGRWTAIGKEGVYQRMPEADRPARITIAGEPAAELDVSACQLSIVHGLMGLPLPEGDLYGVAGFPRDVVKAWITSTLGKGSAVTKWSRRDPKAFAQNSHYDPKEVGSAVGRRYPFLRGPVQSLSGPAGLDRWRNIAKPEVLLTHRLMNVEAEALTLAMRALRNDWRALALPLHDGLIVQRSVGHGGGGYAGVGLRARCGCPLSGDRRAAAGAAGVGGGVIGLSTLRQRYGALHVRWGDGL